MVAITKKSRSEGLESLIRISPDKYARNPAGVLVVSDSDMTLADFVVEQGHEAAVVSSLQLAEAYALAGNIDMVMIDVKGKLSVEKSSETSYFRELKSLLSVLSSERSLPTAIFDSSGLQVEENLLPLANRGAMLDDSGPYSIDALSETGAGSFPSAFETKLSERRRAAEDFASTTARRVVTVETDDIHLPVDIGHDVERLYREGALPFAGDDSIKGAFTPLNPADVVSPSVKTVHFKRVKPSEAENFDRTQKRVSEKFPNLHTPEEYGNVVDGDTAIAARTFVPATTLAYAARILSSDSPHSGVKPNSKEDRLWRAMFEYFSGEVVPDWFKQTHSQAKNNSHTEARHDTTQRWKRQSGLLLHNMRRVLSPAGSIPYAEEVVAAIDDVFNGYRPHSDLYVSPMDPKGSNLGFRTGIGHPSAEQLVNMFFDGRDIDMDALQRSAAIWDYKMLGTVSSVFVEALQMLNDPWLYLRDEEKPDLLFRMAERGVDTWVDKGNPYLGDILIQGTHKSLLKTFVTVAHSQENERRYALMANRDKAAYLTAQAGFEYAFEYHLRQALLWLSFSHSMHKEQVVVPARNGAVGDLNEFRSAMAEWFGKETGENYSISALSRSDRENPVLRGTKFISDVLQRILDIEGPRINTSNLRNDALTGRTHRYS